MVYFKHKYITMPQVTAVGANIDAAQYITKILQPTATVNFSLMQLQQLKQLVEVYQLAEEKMTTRQAEKIINVLPARTSKEPTLRVGE